MNGLDPVQVYDAIERVREWYWADPERHRVGRLDLAAARRDVVQIALAEIGIDNPTLARQIGDTYHDLRDSGLQPFADAIDTVQWLRAGGCRLALLTNGSAQMQRSKITRFGLAEFFDAILIEGELGFGKPDSRVYRRALEALGVAPGETGWSVTISNGTSQSRSGRASMASGSISEGEGCRRVIQRRPDRIIRRLSELRDLAAEDRS